MLVFKRDICIKSWVASDQIINNTVKRQLLCETAARANIIPLQSLALKGLCPCLKCTVRCSSHNQNERKKKKKTFQNVQIPHKIGMFVQHQKGTAGWRCSIWPNMEGKNAAFSRNQTGKKKENEKKKKVGRFSCMLRAQRRWSSHTRSHTVAAELASSQSSLTDGDVGPAVTPQPTLLAGAAHLHDHLSSVLKYHILFCTQQLSSLKHMSSKKEPLQFILNPPLERENSSHL